MRAGECDGSAAQRLKKLIDRDVNTTHLFSFSLPLLLCLLVSHSHSQTITLTLSLTRPLASLITQPPPFSKRNVLYSTETTRRVSLHPAYATGPSEILKNLRSYFLWSVNMYFDCEYASVSRHSEMIRRQSISTLTGKRAFHNAAQLLYDAYHL